MGKAVGRTGTLTIIGWGKEPYVGQVNLVTGEIGDDMANYCGFLSSSHLL